MATATAIEPTTTTAASASTPAPAPGEGVIWGVVVVVPPLGFGVTFGFGAVVFTAGFVHGCAFVLF